MDLSMRVSPVSLDACGYCTFQSLINPPRPAGSSVLVDIEGGHSRKTNSAALFFGTIDHLNRTAYQPKDEIIRDPAFVNLWLQFPNHLIKQLVDTIVKPSDSDDEKMEKIQKWVVNNIAYTTDEEQYGYSELWVPPVMVLKTKAGDCEDGAFLIMSLALNAGVDPSRLRMYGGLVDAGTGAPSGGHGWVAYRRQSDNEWVALDWSYYPDLSPMEDRTPLRKDTRYIDDYFFITNQYVVVTQSTNRVKEPDIYHADGSVIPNIFFPAGSLLSLYA
jgi:predicted transglutaminase-like cysteine proteinase